MKHPVVLGWFPQPLRGYAGYLPLLFRCRPQENVPSPLQFHVAAEDKIEQESRGCKHPSERIYKCLGCQVQTPLRIRSPLRRSSMQTLTITILQ